VAQRRPANLPFPYGFCELARTCRSRFGNHPSGNIPGITKRVTKEERAKAYLHHILTLTGTTRMGIGYALNVGKVQFQLWDRFVKRLQNPEDPQAPYEETCFFILHSGMPRAEEIATVLLQLFNNPGLFDKWALQKGIPYKADGHMFERTR